MIFIFNYERKAMFKKVLNTLKKYKPIVLDDGSSYAISYPRTLRFENGGKKEFWKKWLVAFELAKGSEDEFFLFTPNDFLDLDMKQIEKLHDQLKDAPYVYNIINDGRDVCWDYRKPLTFDENTDQVFFTDCGFFCNRKALELIEFKIDPINNKRFDRHDISSGVGQQLTWKFNRANVKIYRPMKSLAYHGDHESTMHKDQRKLIPLISK